MAKSKKKLERDFQANLIDELEKRFPDALVTKFDCKQGWPDIFIFCGDRWAALECKREENAEHQANQDYYVERMNNMSFSRFIFPENKEEVLNDLAQVLQVGRSTCRDIRSE